MTCDVDFRYSAGQYSTVLWNHPCSSVGVITGKKLHNDWLLRVMQLGYRPFEQDASTIDHHDVVGNVEHRKHIVRDHNRGNV